MKRQPIIILVLFVFGSSFALPFFAIENCKSTNCAKSTSHCCQSMTEMDCCRNGGCMTVPLHPIAAAPLNIVDLQKDITIDIYSNNSNEVVISTEIFPTDLNNNHSPPDIHSGFQTPLLV